MLDVMDEAELITSRQLCEASGASYRQVDYWRRTGYLTPAAGRGGSGSRFYYTQSDVAKVRLMLMVANFTNSGRSGSSLADILPTLNRLVLTREDYDKFVVSSSGSSEVVSADELAKALQSDGPTLVIPVSSFMEEQ